MIQGVSSKQSAADISKTVDALNQLLTDTYAKSSALADKLLKVNTQTKVGDPMLGTRIDTSA